MRLIPKGKITIYNALGVVGESVYNEVVQYL